MRSKETAILAVSVILIGMAAALLARMQSAQKLGLPGVKLVDRPTTNEAGKILQPFSVYLPEETPFYTSVGLPVTDVEYETLPKDTTFGRRSYRASDGFECRTSVVLMGSDRTSIHKPQYCLVGQGWTIEKSEIETVRMLKPHPYNLQIMKLTLSISFKQGDEVVPIRGIYAYWFVADGRLTHDHWKRMALIAQGMLESNTLQRWAYISYFAYGRPGQEGEVFNRMRQLMIATVPEFQTALGPPEGGLKPTASLGHPAPAAGADSN